MNIALIGVPGSGKTELAKQLAKTFRQEGKRVRIIDHYIPQIEKRTQWALGPFGTHIGNLYVALDRYAREHVARQQEYDVVITCGTLLETAVHLAIYFVGLGQNNDSDEQKAMAPMVEAVLRMFAVLYNDIVEYDHAFYLRPVDPNEDTQFMDRQLQAGVAGFKLLDVTGLEDPETRLQDALDVIGWQLAV